MDALFGPELMRRDGSKLSTKTALETVSYVIAYFSASWCPPCQAFTPVLSEYWKRNHAAKNFAVVFLSMDRSEADQKSYMAKMEWNLSLPHGAPQIEKLAKAYKVQGIPSAIIIDTSTLKPVGGNTRGEIDADPSASGFPYAPKGVVELLEDAGRGKGFVDSAGNAVSLAEVRSKEYLGLYFSAHWCPPCRGFTPKLAAWYKKVTGAGAAFEGKLDIIFVSSDRDQKQFSEYLAEMPWKALHFDERGVKGQLSKLFDVQGIPSLVFISRDGEVISKNGREKVESDPEGFPWPPRPFAALQDSTDAINEEPMLVLFTDMCTDQDKEAEATAAFIQVAEEVFAGDKAVKFAIGAEGDEALDSVRQFLGAAHMRDKNGPTSIRATLLDIPGGKKYLYNDGALGVPTADGLRALVQGYVNGTAKGLPVRG